MMNKWIMPCKNKMCYCIEYLTFNDIYQLNYYKNCFKSNDKYTNKFSIDDIIKIKKKNKLFPNYYP